MQLKSLTSKIWVILFISLCLTQSKNVQGQSSYSFIFEPQLSAQLGAQNILAFNRGLIYLDNKYIPTSFFNEKRALGKIAGISYRASKLFLLHYPISHMMMLYQHEFFGHVARARQIGYGKTIIELNLPPPFMSGSGVAYWSNKYQVTSDQAELMPYLGGVEANNVMADISRAQMLQNDYIHYQEGFLYLYNTMNLPGYVLFSRASSLNDINNYIQKINNLYAPIGKQMQKEQLKIYAFIDWFLDPMLVYSAVAVAKDYLYDGNVSGKIWWIPLGRKMQYLPMFKFELSPYGAELYYENNIKIDKRLMILTLRHADNVLSESFGVDLEGYNILNYKDRIRIDVCMAFWSQPEFIIRGVSGPIDADNDFGMGFTTNLHFNLLPAKLKNYSVNIFAQLGYKTGGYWPGEVLDKSFLWRLGLSYQLKPNASKKYILKLSNKK
ncbi:MAG: hypothetical protein MK207_15795 [Saprospiraceae bacterium]|nr:hypothetical protein [Saprospiraceae bacterium]